MGFQNNRSKQLLHNEAVIRETGGFSHFSRIRLSQAAVIEILNKMELSKSSVCIKPSERIRLLRTAEIPSSNHSTKSIQIGKVKDQALSRITRETIREHPHQEGRCPFISIRPANPAIIPFSTIIKHTISLR